MHQLKPVYTVPRAMLHEAADSVECRGCVWTVCLMLEASKGHQSPMSSD